MIVNKNALINIELSMHFFNLFLYPVFVLMAYNLLFKLVVLKINTNKRREALNSILKFKIVREDYL